MTTCCRENIIYHAVREVRKAKSVVISTSDGLDFDKGHTLSVPYSRIVHSGDPDMFIRLDLDGADLGLAERMKYFTSSLGKLGLGVSTGRVVDFRAREHLRQPTEARDRSIDPSVSFPVWLRRLADGIKKKTKRHHVVVETSDLFIEAGSTCSRKDSHRRNSGDASWQLSTIPQGSMHVSWVQNHLHCFRTGQRAVGRLRRRARALP